MKITPQVASPSLSLLLLFSLFFSLLLSSCSKPSYRSADGLVWSTSYHIVYNAPSDLSDSISAVLSEVGASLSVFDPESLVSQVNARDSVLTDSHFRKVYTKSLEINRASSGLFDPTLSPLITAWGFGRGHTPTADTLRLDSLLDLVGIRRTRLDGPVLRKENPLIAFNFSAVAKGYGADCVGEMLSRNGATDWLVEIGGEIAARGVNPKGQPWKVSIDRPDSPEGNLAHDSFSVVEISSGGLATSGNYRNFHSSGSARYGHTISPLTGRPISTDVVSATVMAPDCMTADALATASMAMGSTAAAAMLDSLKCRYLLIVVNEAGELESISRN